MADHRGEKSFWTFWTTLPGILSGLAAVITAVGGLITTIYFITSSNDSPPTFPTSSPVTRSMPQSRENTPTPTPVPTNTLATAQVSLPREGELELTPGSTEGVIGPEEKIVLWFKVPAGGRVEANIEAAGGTCLGLRLLDPAREQIEESTEECSVSLYFAVLADGSSGGTYYLELESGSSISAGDYTVDLLSQMQDDAGSGGDAGDNLDTALLLEAPSTQQGLVGSQDREDRYRFSADASTVLEVQYAEWDELEVTLLAVDSSGEATGEETLRRDQPVDFGQRPEGDYALRISNRGTEAIYTIILGSKSGL